MKVAEDFKELTNTSDDTFFGKLRKCMSPLDYCSIFYLFYGPNHRVHKEWQLPLTGVHSIMVEKLAQPGGGEGCTPTLFHPIYHHLQSCGVCCS